MIWSTVLLYFYFSGRITSYLHPTFHVYTMLSGVVLCMLAIAFFITGPSKILKPATGRRIIGQIFSTLLLIVPLLAAIVLSPSQFGATAIMNRGFVDNINDLPAFSPPIEPALPANEGSTDEGNTVASDVYLRKNDKGQIKVETVDLLYAASEPTMREDFEDKEVEVIGQFLPAHSGNAQNDRFDVVRMFIVCCAADAQPIGIAVKTSHVVSFPDMTWVKVTGKATFPIESGKRIPLVVAESVTKISPPEQTFIY